MLSVTSALRYQKQILDVLYIRGLIPRNWSRQFRLGETMRYSLGLLSHVCCADVGWPVVWDCDISWSDFNNN